MWADVSVNAFDYEVAICSPSDMLAVESTVPIYGKSVTFSFHLWCDTPFPFYSSSTL
jgi:hypothetical protein